jgi:uncharacterized cupin superfamily protein
LRVLADATGEIGVLHQRQWPEAAELRIEAARDEQALVAIWECEQADADPDAALDEACLPGAVVEGEVEIAGVVGGGCGVRRYC